MANQRPTRDAQTRATYDTQSLVTETSEREVRPSIDSWKPPSILPEINRRDGWEHRWIRTSLLSKADNTNVSTRFREGWEPCKAEDYPEVSLMVDRDSRYPNGVEIGGLLLCRAPEEVVRQRKEYYMRQAHENMIAVDNNLMKESDPRMPIFKEGKTSVSFGRGRK
jgi:hypothetical protein